MKKKLYAIIITVVMLANLVCPAMAQTITANSFTGTINLDSSVASKVDLSDIDIKVYSLTVAYTDPTSGQNDYYDNYVFTVNPAKGGVFTFSKPSAEFKIEIDLSTLPSGIGVDKFECTYENGQINDTFTLYSVHNAEMVMENAYSTPTVICYAQNGNRIFADYDIQLSAESAAVSRSASIDILKTQSATFSGAVSSGNSFSFSKTFDLSEMSSLDKVNFYANTKMITEEEKIERYCDLVETMDFEDMVCINPVYDVLRNYVLNHDEKASSELGQRIAQLTSKPEVSRNGGSVSNDYFIVYYDSNDIATKANIIAQLLLAYRRNALAMGFNDPTRVVNSNETKKIEVFMYKNEGENSSAFGKASIDCAGSTSYTCHTYLCIYKVSSQDTRTQLAETVAHEYFHAVQNAHNCNNDLTAQWFDEASACWFSTYLGFCYRTTDDIKDYTDQFFISQPLEQYLEAAANFNYGKVLFPLAVDIAYGGYTTIKNIYNNLPTEKQYYTAADLRTAITTAIQIYDSNASFISAVKKMALFTSDPNYYYASRIPYIDAEESDEKYDWQTSENMAVSPSNYAYTVYSFGIKYFLIKPTGTAIQNFSGTITTNSVANCSVAKTYKTSSNTYTDYTVTLNTSPYSFSESNVGSSSKQAVMIIIVNTGTSDSGITVAVNGTFG